VHLPAEKALEGKYVIQTEELDLSAVQAVEAYKELSEVERGFRELKDLIEMRPIYHHRPKRVRAHIFVAALAFLLACDVQRPGIGSLAPWMQLGLSLDDKSGRLILTLCFVWLLTLPKTHRNTNS
jgi:hypothetical protein